MWKDDINVIYAQPYVTSIELRCSRKPQYFIFFRQSTYIAFEFINKNNKIMEEDKETDELRKKLRAQQEALDKC